METFCRIWVFLQTHKIGIRDFALLTSSGSLSVKIKVSFTIAKVQELSRLTSFKMVVYEELYLEAVNNNKYIELDCTT